MDKEFWTARFFELVRLLLGNAWNRTGAAIAIAGVSVLTGWIDKFVMAVTKVHWEETEQWIGWVLLAIGLAMLFYGAWKSRVPNPHDVELIARFRRLFERSDLEFLTSHNFADNWHVTRTAPMEDMADDWLGAQFEFVDKKLNKLLARVKELSTEFANAEGFGFSIGPNLQMRTMKTIPDQNGLTQQTRDKIDNLGRIARALAVAINALERAAKVRLPVT